MAQGPRIEPLTLELPGVEVLAWRSASLGNWTYLIASDGEAIVVDPRRRIDLYLEAAYERNVRIRHVVETHVHSDYLSGAMMLSRAAGAEIVAPGLGKYEFGHRQAWDGDEVIAGAAALTCISTPGHTYDHVAWQLNTDVASDPVAVLTGGSLLAGGAGRTDLMGDLATPRLTQLQFSSLRRLATLPPEAFVLPTHGGGSTCSVGSAAQEPGAGFTTVATELALNAYLMAVDVDEFDARLAISRAPAPAYFPDVAQHNRRGVGRPVRPAPPEPLGPGGFARAARLGAVVVDARDRWEFADRHIPGALNVEALDTFAGYVGSMIPYGTPIALVVADRDVALVPDLVAAAFDIGYRVDALLDPGIEEWEAAGFPLASYPASDVFELIDEARHGRTPAVLDVRDPSEWSDGIVTGSTTITLRALPPRAPELPGLLVPRAGDGQISVACRGGARASVAASYLAGLGIPVRAVLGGGIPDVLSALSAAQAS